MSVSACVWMRVCGCVCVYVWGGVGRTVAGDEARKGELVCGVNDLGGCRGGGRGG